MAHWLSRKAEDDIIKIFVRGVAEFGLPQAERYHSELEHTFRFLDEKATWRTSTRRDQPGRINVVLVL